MMLGRYRGDVEWKPDTKRTVDIVESNYNIARDPTKNWAARGKSRESVDCSLT